MYSASAFVSQLQELGCSVALDDFGNGSCYCGCNPEGSANYEFKNGGRICESEEILEFLAEMGVNYAQGFHTGKPVTLEKLLQREDNEK